MSLEEKRSCLLWKIISLFEIVGKLIGLTMEAVIDIIILVSIGTLLNKNIFMFLLYY